MDALERLVAIQEIRDQIARYAIFYDDKNWDDFAELWADDAAFVGPGMAFEGKQAVLDFLTTCLPDDYTGKHMNSPALIELTGPGRARARTDVVWITMDFANQIVARYDDMLPPGRRPLAVRAAHRGRRAVPARRATDVRHGHGGQQLDDAPLAHRRGRSERMTVDLATLIDPAAHPDADRERLPVHRGARLGHPRRTASCTSDIPGDARWRWTRAGGVELDLAPTFKGNGMALRQRRPPARLRAGLELPRALPRRQARARRLPLPRQVPEQPERRGHARQRRQHLLHRSRLRPLERLDRPGAQPRRRRLPRRLPRAARRRRARARRGGGRVRPARTASASRPTRSSCTSTTPAT